MMSLELFLRATSNDLGLLCRARVGQASLLLLLIYYQSKKLLIIQDSIASLRLLREMLGSCGSLMVELRYLKLIKTWLCN